MKILIAFLISCVSLCASTLTDSVTTAYIDGFQTTIQGIQASELSANKLHTQLPWTHTSPPEDGIGVVPDNLAEVVDGGGRKYGDVIDLTTTTMRARIKIDVYDGESGKGYIVTLELIEGGKTYRKVFNYGQETGRSFDWIEIVQATILQ